MTCTGPYSFSMSYHFEKPKEEKGILSSFLKSDAISEMEETTDNTCDTANCFECSSNQTRDINGNCVDIHVGCSSGQEEINGSCMDACTPPQVRNPFSGACEDPGCSAGEEMVSGSCVPVCTYPQVRNSAGVCEDPGCPDGKEKWSDTCVDPCIPPQTRQSDGTCASAYCGNGTVE